jgi:hypothetical protein
MNLKKSKRIEKDFSSILANLKERDSLVFRIWSLQFGIYLKFEACDLLFPVYPGWV